MNVEISETIMARKLG